MICRRGFIAGIAGLLVAPAIVRASSLMPVKAMTPNWRWGVQNIDLRPGAVNYADTSGMLFTGPMTATEIIARQAAAELRWKASLDRLFQPAIDIAMRRIEAKNRLPA